MKKTTLIIGTRVSDKTEELAKWCQKNNGVMWCSTESEAQKVRKKYNIEAYSPERNTSLKGMNKPVALNDFFFNPLILRFMSFACYQSRGKIEIILDEEGEVFELKMVTE